VAGAAEDVFDLMPDEFLHARPGRAEVLARIEFFGDSKKTLRMPGRQGQAEVGVNVHLGATGAAGDFDVRFGAPPAASSPSLPPYFVDLEDEVLGHAGGAVEDQR